MSPWSFEEHHHSLSNSRKSVGKFYRLRREEQPIANARMKNDKHFIKVRATEDRGYRAHSHWNLDESSALRDYWDGHFYDSTRGGIVHPSAEQTQCHGAAKSTDSKSRALV